MKKTSVDIDEVLLDEVRNLLGTSTIKQTVDTALRETLRSEARRQEVRTLAAMNGLDLADEAVMANAWRGQDR